MGKLPGLATLDKVDMWVQLYDLPVGYTTGVILEQIGNFIGTFVKCDDRQTRDSCRIFYRIRVSIPVDKPIKRRMKLFKRDKSWSWVNFKYERLHTFCFFCGFIGYSRRFCLKTRESTVPVEQYPYGAGLRAGLS